MGGRNETTPTFVVAGISSWISIATGWTKSSGLCGIEEKNMASLHSLSLEDHY